MEEITQTQWGELAAQAFFRLKDIVELADVEDKRLLGAIKEAFDRAYGKSKESIDVTSGGERIFVEGFIYKRPED